MSEATAILLAAGLSRRMGAKNKLLLPIGGTPMVRHVALTYLASIDGPLTVVPGFKADRIATALQTSSWRTTVPLTAANQAPSRRGWQLRRMQIFC